MVDDVGFNGADSRRREAVGAREALKSRPRATRAGRLGSHSRICRNRASAQRYPSCPPARPRAPRGYCPRLRAIFPRLWRAAPLAGSMRRTCRKASSYVPVDMGAMLQRGFSGGFCGEDSESKGIPPGQRGSPFMRC